MSGTVRRKSSPVLFIGSSLIALLTLASVLGRWHLLAILAVLIVATNAWNALFIFKLTARLGLARSEALRVTGNVLFVVLVGHLTGWTLANWLWLPFWGLDAEGSKVDRWSALRFALASGAVSISAVVAGVAPLVPICFCVLAGICYAISSARESVIIDMLRDSDVKKEILAATNAELSELPRLIQTSILPRRCDVDRLEVSARMIAMQDVGGDYYDILPARDGAWIAIGDVAGHGLQAGLIMLMVQSAVASLTRATPDAKPAEIVTLLNEVLFENIHNRLGRDEHVTLSLLRQYHDGRVELAGAHEDLVVWRAESGRCETVETHGTWLGVRPSVAEATVTSSIQLRDGDLLILYTDGITEPRSATGQEFGLDRLCRVIETVGAQPAQDIREHVLETVGNWSATPDDDRTLLVIRYRAPRVSAADYLPADPPGRFAPS